MNLIISCEGIICSLLISSTSKNVKSKLYFSKSSSKLNKYCSDNLFCMSMGIISFKLISILRRGIDAVYIGFILIILNTSLHLLNSSFNKKIKSWIFFWVFNSLSLFFSLLSNSINISISLLSMLNPVEYEP